MMEIRKIIREELYRSFNCSIFVKKENIMSEGHVTVDSNYEFPPIKIWEKMDELKSIGNKLDRNYSDNIANLQVLSTGERSGRLLAEIGYPDGTVVLFYKSSQGTSGKEKGGWFPIPGFTNASAPVLRVKSGWFIKTEGVDDRYGVKTFQGTADYLKANEGSIDEIYLSVNNYQGVKPGVGVQFPSEKEGGSSLNISTKDSSREFPSEEDLK